MSSGFSNLLYTVHTALWGPNEAGQTHFRFTQGKMWMLLWGKADWKERKSIDMPVWFYFNDFVCMYMCLCSCECTCMFLHMLMKARVNIRCLSQSPPLVRQGFSLCLECIDLAELTDQWAPGIHLSPSSQLWVYRLDITPSFYVGTRDLNSNPHTCMTGTLLTHLSPQPLTLLLNARP